MGEIISAYEVLVWRSEGKRQLKDLATDERFNINVCMDLK
jgi:hypothetical protein